MAKLAGANPRFGNTILTMALRFGLSVALLAGVPGCVAPEQSGPQIDANTLLMRLMDLVAAHRLVDRGAVEQSLGIAIKTDAGEHSGFGRVVGWLAPAGKLADLAYYQRPDTVDRATVAFYNTGAASISLGLERSRCLSLDSLQTVFQRNGWSYRGELRSTAQDVLTPGNVVLEYAPYFEAIGELKGSGRLTFQFSHAGKNCATSVLASQFR